MKRILVVLLNLALLLPPHQVQAMEARAIWPKAPFRPHLIHVAPGSEKLCVRYELEAITRYFAGYSLLETSLTEQEEKSVAEAGSLEDLVGVEDPIYNMSLYSGDWDGDGLDDKVLAIRTGAGRYRYHFNLLKLTPARLQLLRSEFADVDKGDSAKSKSERSRALGRLRLAMASEQNPRLRERPSSERAAVAAEQAMFLMESMRIRSLEGRMYTDGPVPDNENTERVLLSYDVEMSPRAECVVAVKGLLEEIDNDPWGTGPLWSVLDSYTKTLGAAVPCQMGTSTPFRDHRWTRDALLHDSLFRPWGSFSKTDGWSRFLRSHSHSDEVIGTQGHWTFNAFQYYWSLEGAFNRRAYRHFQSDSTDGLWQLASFYTEQYNVDNGLAREWAGFYVHAFRVLSSGSGDYGFGHWHSTGELERIRDGEAHTSDFIELAGTRQITRGMAYARGEQPSEPVVDHGKALSLAVGAYAPPEILESIIQQGADVNSARESVILNAVDNSDILSFLLRAGALVDRPNGFGKTALMMAAHLDEADAVRTLLSAGANPNQKTWKDLPDVEDWMGRMRPDCRYTALKFRERTALMYAAENASLQVIRLLLDAGADRSAVDTGGRSVLDYLAMNRHLTAREGKKAKRILSVD